MTKYTMNSCSTNNSPTNYGIISDDELQETVRGILNKDYLADTDKITEADLRKWPDLMGRIHNALGRLFTSHKFSHEIPSQQETAYAYYLFHSVAQFRVSDITDNLRDKILSGKYISVPKVPHALPASAPDLQFILLKVLLEHNPNKKNIDIFKKFFTAQDGRYANLCYRGLWENNPNHGITHAFRLARLCGEKTTPVGGIFDWEFGEFLRKHSSISVGCDFSKLDDEPNKPDHAIILQNIHKALAFHP